MSRYLALTSGPDQPLYLLGGSGIQVLGDPGGFHLNGCASCRDRSFAEHDVARHERLVCLQIVAHAFVDYRWTADFDVVVGHRLNDRFSLYGRSWGEVLGVAASSPRDTQKSGHIEGGVRVNGRGAALELFAGYERRADANPFDQQPLKWGLAGFRLVNK